MTETRLSVDIYSDIACPWCFIGKRRFEKAVQALPFGEKIDVKWHAFQLDPSLPEHYDGSELDYLVKAKGMPEDQVAGMLQHVTAQAEAEGLSYDFEALRPANSFTALRLLALAKERGLGGEMKEALLSAHFEKGLDTGDKKTLQAIAQQVGLEATEAAEVLGGDKYADEVHNDGVRAREMGVTGVPFFIFENKYGVSGAQPTEVFEQALSQVWKEIGGESLRMMATPSTDGEACGPEGCN
ncbi:disulfide bond formation protein DsbA [Arthrobacter sp. MYb227]|uniref:DsbA family oxidoreductase n=1 Tax=Arthrobacter sp. MYb227 TaxID=1848601 RepID=UPI000CFCF59C|nr:DsbA family oxidoreductase [Arthrobacter sp. MYb227]PQZ89607.1 disulfide bond formation protein DsbA [Arthrobacter sp. MYb227]